jgi:hypothetical protein
MKIHHPVLDLLRVYRLTSPKMTFIKPDSIKDDDAMTHAQNIMGIGLLFVSHHEFQHQYVHQN